MKNIYLIIGLFFIILSCKKNEIYNSVENKELTLTFPDLVLDAVIIRQDGNIYLESDSLVKIEFTDSDGNKSYGYKLKSNVSYTSRFYNTNHIEGGYAFDGRCFIYGHFAHYDDYVDFTPCGSRCVGFNKICPDEGQGYAK